MKKYNKELIKKRFEHSFPTYNQNAPVQRLMAYYLAEKIKAYSGNIHPITLEIGCGTGFLTSCLVDFDIKKLLINDLSPEVISYIEKIAPHASFLIGDMEVLRFENKFDLIASNAVFQWAEDLDIMLKRFHKILKKGGTLAFTTFGENNFEEISKTTKKKLWYKSLKELKELFSGFEIQYLEKTTEKMEFDTAKDVLKHIKHIGANAITTQVWTKKDLIEFEKNYEIFCDKGKYILTYEPVYVVLQKITDVNI